MDLLVSAALFNSQKKGNKQKDPTTKAKSSNFSLAEDVYIAKAWVYVSEDSVVGVGQRIDDYWKKLFVAFCEWCDRDRNVDLSPVERGRTPTSVMERWNRVINKRVQAFAATYKQVTRSPKSGWKEDDYINAALKLFTVKVRT